jgi:hypothetical protein
MIKFRPVQDVLFHDNQERNSNKDGWNNIEIIGVNATALWMCV